MTLKRRIAVYTSLLFSLVSLLAFVLVFVLFADFRKDEFRERLEEKAQTTIRLLTKVKQVDRELLRIIDRNTINKLYNEKVLVFDSSFNLIYSSVDDAVVNWTMDDLGYLKHHGNFFKKQGDYEVYGVFYDSDQQDYYALIAAEDTHGIRKLRYLGLIMIGSYILFTGLIWFTAYSFTRKLLSPLDSFLKQIIRIQENKLNLRVSADAGKPQDEINQLALEFNQMMDRIEQSYTHQKTFSFYASHELRTPLARILARIENKRNDPALTPDQVILFRDMARDINQLTDLINSLLVLGRDENKEQLFARERLDELVFETFTHIKEQFPEYQLNFEISGQENLDVLMELEVNRELLRIALMNLIKNACQYSENKTAMVRFESEGNSLLLSISAKGKLLDEDEQKNLFKPFARGKNAQAHTGFGLGLVIAQRILGYHHATITYDPIPPDINQFIVRFTPVF